MEIGSIFEIDVRDFFNSGHKGFYLPFMENKIYKYHRFFNTGRSAIEYLLNELDLLREKRKILIPAFTCSSIIDAITRAGFEYSFYGITQNFFINIDSIQKEIDGDVGYIYIIQFFGGYQNKETFDFIKQLQRKGYIIIEDISHALYTSHEKYIGFGDYVLGSIRKWLPIPDGAFLSSSKKLNNTFIEQGYNEYSFCYLIAQIMKTYYLEDNMLGKKGFLELNDIAMKALFSDYTIREMTVLSKNYLFSYDMDEVIQKRVQNYEYLSEETRCLSFIKPVFIPRKGQVPFGFVVLVGDRDPLLRYLISNNIYCNIHWNITEECRKADAVSDKLSNMILTIPCDQRYGKVEMDYIIGVLNSYSV